MHHKAVALFICACALNCSDPDPEDPELVIDVGADATAADMDVGGDIGSLRLPRACTSNDLPRIVKATLDPARLSVSELDDAAVDLEIWVACFSGPIEHVTVAAGDPPRELRAEEPAESDGRIFVEGVLVADWLDGLVPGTYELTITASSAGETLSERGLISIEIEE